jgi:phage-related protein
MAETRKTRPVSWLRAARHEFEKLPEGARKVCLTALTIAAEGGKADIAKPLQGVGSGVLEIVLPFKGDAFRVVYALQLPPGYLGDTCFSKEVDHGNKDTQARD